MADRSDTREARVAVGHYITALMVDGGANVAACERAMDEAFAFLDESLAAERATLREALSRIEQDARADGNTWIAGMARAALVSGEES